MSDIQIDESSIKPINQTAAPTAVGATAAPGSSEQVPPAANLSGPSNDSNIDESSIKPVSEEGVAPVVKPATPQGEIRAGGSPSLVEAVTSKNVGGMLKLWADNVANDIKYGTDTTGIGTLLKKMGAHGVYMGNPQAVGDFMASMPLGLLKAGGAAANANNAPMQSAEDMVSGGIQAATMPGAFMAPELSEEGAAAMGATARGVGTIAGKVAQVPKRVAQAFKEPLDVDKEAIAHSAMRGVQPRMMSSLRSMMKSLESEFGIEKPAGSTPEAPVEQQSIRDAVKKTADAFHARARSIYTALDKATGGQFQRFENQLRDINSELGKLINTPDEASMTQEAALDARKAAIEEARDAAFDRAKEQGVDPNLIENARSDFKRSQALYDLDYNVKKVASGARPGNPNMLPEDVARDPEMLHPERMQKRLDTLYDSGRLQEAVGNENANKMLAEASKNKVQVKQATREATEAAVKRTRQNKTIRHVTEGAAVGAAGLAGAGKLATHIFMPGVGITPVQ